MHCADDLLCNIVGVGRGGLASNESSNLKFIFLNTILYFAGCLDLLDRINYQLKHNSTLNLLLCFIVISTNNQNSCLLLFLSARI